MKNKNQIKIQNPQTGKSYRKFQPIVFSCILTDDCLGAFFCLEASPGTGTPKTIGRSLIKTTTSSRQRIGLDAIGSCQVKNLAARTNFKQMLGSVCGVISHGPKTNDGR